MDQEFIMALEHIDEHPAFIEKVAAENDRIPTGKNDKRTTSYRTRENAWVRKKRYKERLERQFLSWCPSMHLNDVPGFHAHRGIWIRPHENNTDPYRYVLNPYVGLYKSVRGDVRKYWGRVYWRRIWFHLYEQYPIYARVTNRRVRHLRIEEDECAFREKTYRKMFAPFQYIG